MYRAYTAECLRMLTQTSANGAFGPYMTAKYMDILNPKPEDDRTGQEIRQYMIKKLRGEVWDESV